MFKVKRTEIYASEIAAYLNCRFSGEDFIIRFPSTIASPTSNSVLFINDSKDVDRLVEINKENLLAIIPVNISSDIFPFPFIKSKNPELDFVRVINEYFLEINTSTISGSAKIDKEAKIGRNVSIGENVVIGPEVVIGENVIILNNVVISSRVSIGSNCIIKDNSVIGSMGFDFVNDEKGLPLLFPHLGEIIIGNNVLIGANTSIESATVDNTIISDFVKIDDLVQMGYNCKIGLRTMITAGVIVCRNVRIAEDCWIAPNSTIRDNVNIAKNVIIGMGSVVLDDIVDSNSVFAGNPAKLLKRKAI